MIFLQSMETQIFYITIFVSIAGITNFCKTPLTARNASFYFTFLPSTIKITHFLHNFLSLTNVNTHLYDFRGGINF